jgi:broad specificity phosphatase PhoE
MKWPKSITFIRHGESAYNILKSKKQADPEYQEFVKAFNRDHTSKKTRRLAKVISVRYQSKTSDAATPLTSAGIKQAFVTGSRIFEVAPTPHVVLISPYRRTNETHEQIALGANLTPDSYPLVTDDRIREQEHGLSILYSDWRVFYTMHPDQKLLHDRQGPYWYQYPQGESVSMVRDRIRSFNDMLIREYAEKDVWVISHHLTKLSFRANIERWSPEEFIRVDNEEKPVNCGVTTYGCNPKAGKNGKLELQHYNLKLY